MSSAIGRFLSAAGYRHLASEGGAPALDHLRVVLDGWLGEIAQMGDASPPTLPPNDLLTRSLFPLPADVIVAVGDYVRSAALLGTRVGEMHKLLSRTDIEAFAPEALDTAAREEIAVGVRAELKRALADTGGRAATLPAAARDALGAVRSKLDSIERRLVNATRAPEGGVRIRIHGQLDLERVRSIGEDFAMSDFAADERKRSPLVDVASILRAFHYAAVLGLRARRASATSLGPWMGLWHRSVAASFLSGWLRAVAESTVLPAAPAVTRALLDSFLLERCVHELGAATAPELVEVPLLGIKDILETERKPGQMRTSRSFTPFVAPPAETARVEPSRLDAGSPEVVAFKDGTSTRAQDLLGAHLRPDGFTELAVWAPNALQVAVAGDFNAWAPERGLLAPVGDTGIFAGRIHGAVVGQRWQLRIAPPEEGAPIEKLDPFARVVDGNMAVIGSPHALEHAWADGEWMASRAERGDRARRPLAILEADLDGWRKPYRELAPALAQQAKDLGFTHVALRALVPAGGSFFTPPSSWGAPADLMFVVDALHRAGIGVVFDVALGELGRGDGAPAELAWFDGGAAFEPDDAGRAGQFDIARPEVRSFLLSSVLHWIEAFHADGLRLGGLGGILYRDHRRAPGTWSPNEDGGRESVEGFAFVRRLVGTVRAAHPHVLLVAEGAGGAELGFDFGWNAGLFHDLAFHLSLPERERARHTVALSQGGGAAVVAFSKAEMAGASPEVTALLFPIAWAHPGPKLAYVEPAPPAKTRALLAELNRVLRENPALGAGPSAFAEVATGAPGAVAFERRSAHGTVVVACNFAGGPAKCRVRVAPGSGGWRQLWARGEQGEPVEVGPRERETESDGAIPVTLPPHGAVLLLSL